MSDDEEKPMQGRKKATGGRELLWPQNQICVQKLVGFLSVVCVSVFRILFYLVPLLGVCMATTGRG